MRQETFSVKITSKAGSTVLCEDELLVICSGGNTEERVEEARKYAMGACCAARLEFPGSETFCKIKDMKILEDLL